MKQFQSVHGVQADQVAILAQAVASFGFSLEALTLEQVVPVPNPNRLAPNAQPVIPMSIFLLLFGIETSEKITFPSQAEIEQRIQELHRTMNR